MPIPRRSSMTYLVLRRAVSANAPVRFPGVELIVLVDLAARARPDRHPAFPFGPVLEDCCRLLVVCLHTVVMLGER